MVVTVGVWCHSYRCTVPERGPALPRCVWLINGAEMSSALRILIVDDSDVTRRILGTIVRSRHWTVCGEAEDGGSGVKKFHELKPDLVLLDLAMLDMDGIEAARLISRSDPWNLLKSIETAVTQSYGPIQ